MPRQDRTGFIHPSLCQPSTDSTTPPPPFANTLRCVVMAMIHAVLHIKIHTVMNHQSYSGASTCIFTLSCEVVVLLVIVVVVVVFSTAHAEPHRSTEGGWYTALPGGDQAYCYMLPQVTGGCLEYDGGNMGAWDTQGWIGWMDGMEPHGCHINILLRYGQMNDTPA